MSTIITAQEVLRKGFLALKNGKLEWTEGNWGVKEDGSDISDIIQYAEDGGDIKEIKQVCSIGLVDWVIASTPGLTKTQKAKLRQEAAELLVGSIYDWASSSEDTQKAYKNYVEEVQRAVKDSQESLVETLRDLLESEGIESLEKVEVETLVTPLSFELWVDSEDGKDYIDEKVIGLSRDDDAVSNVIEFNDGGGNTAESIKEIFSRAAYKGKKRR